MAVKMKLVMLVAYVLGAAVVAMATDPEPPKTVKWSPGYVHAAMADAWADVLRSKASQNIAAATAAGQPGGKSKSFSYTNVQLNSNGGATAVEAATAAAILKNPEKVGLIPVQQVVLPPATQPPSSPFTTQNVPVSGARPAEQSPPPFTTEAAAAPPATEVAMQAQIEAYKTQLDALMAQLAASKAGR